MGAWASMTFGLFPLPGGRQVRHGNHAVQKGLHPPFAVLARSIHPLPIYN